MPGTIEWEAFTSKEEMLAAVQIPDNVLNTMTSKALVETVINYPLAGDWMAYLDINEALEYQVSTFNGLRELINRSDSGAVLFETYKSYNVLGYADEWSLERQGNYAFQLSYIEQLLSLDKILNTMDDVAQDALLREALLKYTLKLDNQELYSIVSIERSVYLTYKILLNSGRTTECKIDSVADEFLRVGFFSQYSDELIIPAIESIINCAVTSLMPNFANCDTANPACKSTFDYDWVWVNTVYDSGEYLEPNNPGDFELSFKDSRVYIKTDCNKMSAVYTLEQNTLTFGSISSTKMGCEGSKESQFASVLEGVNSFSVTPDGRLILYFESEEGGGMSIFSQAVGR